MLRRLFHRLILFGCLGLSVAVAVTAAGRAGAGPVIGADLSYLPRLQAAGAIYRRDGASVEPLQLFRESGFEMVRLRLWHSPGEPWHGLDSTMAMAHRVRAAGFDWMLDFHYSDTWADPGQQAKPAAWASLPYSVLVDSVEAWTAAVILRCRDENVLPKYVQLGNEIDGGLLWDDGRVGWPGSTWDTPAQWDRLAGLLQAAARGARTGLEVWEEPRLVIHIADGGNNVRARWFFDNLAARDVDFDAIGVSWYPWWHGPVTALGPNLHDLAVRYGREVWIVETATPWTLASGDGTGNFVTQPDQLDPGYGASPGGQLALLQDLVSLVRGLPDGRGGGVLCWEPEFTPVAGGPPNPSENLALFDFDGNALPALRYGAVRAASAHATVQVIGDFNGWSTAVPSMTPGPDEIWLDTLVVNAGCHLFKFRTDNAWDVPRDYGGCGAEQAGCAIGWVGSVCLVAGPGTALGRVDFPVTGPYLFRLDERNWRYEIRPLVTGAVTETPPAIGPVIEPNPSTGALAIRFMLQRPGRVDVAVFDANGRRLRTLADGARAPGPQSLTWDGADDAGQPVAAGTYLIRLALPDSTVTRRAIIVR